MALTRNERILDLWEYGLSTSAISERLGVGGKTIRIVLKNAGYDLATSPRTRYDTTGDVGLRKASPELSE